MKASLPSPQKDVTVVDSGVIQGLAWQANQRLRHCDDAQLSPALVEQLQALAQACTLHGAALAIRTPARRWSIVAHFVQPGIASGWPADAQVAEALEGLPGWEAESLACLADGSAVPFRNHHEPMAWLLCQGPVGVTFDDAQQWLAAVAQPVLARLAESPQPLTHSAKMATLGEMATGLAHEINQPLNVMRMAIVNLLKRMGHGDLQRDYLQDKLQRIDAQVQRAAQVVDHMRVFGRRAQGQQQLFDPWLAVEGARALLAQTLTSQGIDLRLTREPGQGVVRGHVEQLQQVMVNLMVNARDGLSSRRDIETGLQPWLAVTLENQGATLRIFVEDNAGGIEPALLEKIFEPFFTTKPVGVGTGLGLSVSYGIVENMGGRLTVDNAAYGARFCVELPLASVSDQCGG